MDQPSTPAAGGFPATRYSVVRAVASTEPEVRQRAFGRLVEAYWKPVYKYLRVRWRASEEDAADLAQEFFLRALEKSFFGRYDPEKALFRTYLRTCLDRFAANRRRAEGRARRGGGARHLSLSFAPSLHLDYGSAEGELLELGIPDEVDVEEYFHREWLRSFFGLVVEDLRRRAEELGKEQAFRLFERYDLEGADDPDRPTYARLAEEHDLPVTQVTNYLAWARRELRRLTLERLGELAGSERELRAEARLLLGVEIPG